ncbi:MAG: CoA transferase [Chloroflexi bacterium]|nr:CoA transferase [Chloroflexota bacterium]MDA1002530.1 CoA transferase [Chloroflexota bacterium]
MEQPLAGIRVIEVGGTLAVAGATKTFSDFGADVIKVEPRGGAEMRRLPPFRDDEPGPERGAIHIALDTGKRSLVLDLTTPSGREVLTRLAATARLVFVHLPREQALAALDAVGRATPRPSTVALAAHGLEGPYADRVENDMSLFAWSSRMRTHSNPNMAPLRYGSGVPTMQWAATAAAAGVAAAWGHEHDGTARAIEVAGVEALLSNVDAWYAVWAFNGMELPRGGGPSKTAYPAGCYPCSDGYVLFASAGEPFFSRLCTGIGHPELPADPRFSTPAAKAEHWEDFVGYLGPWLAIRTRDQAFSELQQHGVMLAPVLTIPEAMATPQAVARSSFVTAPLADGGTTTLAGPPFRLPDAWEIRAAPRLGEHNTELLDTLGYSRDEQIALYRAGVTG